MQPGRPRLPNGDVPTRRRVSHVRFTRLARAVSSALQHGHASRRQKEEQVERLHKGYVEQAPKAGWCEGGTKATVEATKEGLGAAEKVTC